jgi:hypothetical protein
VPEPTNPKRRPLLPVSPELALLLLALAALTSAAAACRHTTAEPFARMEITERPDAGGDATWCGALRPGVRAIVRGHVEASGPDAFDRFAFVATSACTLRFRVRPSLPGADLDLCAFDAASGRVRAVADREDEEESGTLGIERAGVPIDLVVTSAWGSSAYTLDVEAVEFAPDGLEANARAPEPCPWKHTASRLEDRLRRGGEPAAAARVSLARAALADRGFPVETGLLQASGTATR